MFSKESITLPVLQELDPLCPGLQAIKKLLFNSRRLSTKKSYNAKWARFVHLCTLVQDEAGSHRLQSLPASQATLLAYIGFTAQESNIRSSSLQPYLSAINSVHADFGFDKPAQGHWIIQARRGFGELEGAQGVQIKKACPFPAQHMRDILRFELHDNTSDNDVRKCACLAAQFAFFARAESGWLLRAHHVLLHDDTFSVNVSAKTVERIQAAPFSRHTNIQHHHHMAAGHHGDSRVARPAWRAVYRPLAASRRCIRRSRHQCVSAKNYGTGPLV